MKDVRLRQAALGLLFASTTGCEVVGPSCLDRQKRGPVTHVSGEVGPAAVVVHRVPYGTQGSQNDVHISWAGQHTAGGPRIGVFATKMECVDFVPPSSASGSNAGVCANIGVVGGTLSETGEFVQSSLVVTNGRGNPDILGVAAEYKLWVVGDPKGGARYTADITWFHGPDC